MTVPYERILAWLVGPVAIIAGAVAVWLDNHFSLLGKAGLGKDQTAKAIVDATTFIVGAGLTYLGQAKWMTNLTAWWRNLQTAGGTPANFGSDMTEEPQTPDQPEPVEEPFVEEPGYDEPGPGVEPDQELDEPGAPEQQGA